MRKFKVHVWQHARKRWLQYPSVTGLAAIKSMETLTARGFQVKAVTQHNGIYESFTLPELLELVVTT